MNLLNQLNKEKNSISKPPFYKRGSFVFWFDIALNLIIIIGLVFLIRTFIISPFQVFGPSMCNTFNFYNGECQKSYGEYIIVNKFGYQNFIGWQVGLPERGDVIVFHPPRNNNEFFIKRIIGLPGETIELKDGYVYIKDTESQTSYRLEEEYLNSENLGNTHPRGGPTIFEIPENSYLALGDNRLKSSDARSCFADSFTSGKCGEDGNTPYLTLNHMEGKAMVVLWPLDRISLVSSPLYQ